MGVFRRGRKAIGDVGDRVSATVGQAGATVHETGERLATGADAVGSGLKHAGERVTTAAGTVGSGLHDAGERAALAADRVSAASEDLGDQLNHARRRTRRKVRRTARRVRRQAKKLEAWTDQHPSGAPRLRRARPRRSVGRRGASGCPPAQAAIVSLAFGARFGPAELAVRGLTSGGVRSPVARSRRAPEVHQADQRRRSLTRRRATTTDSRPTCADNDERPQSRSLTALRRRPPDHGAASRAPRAGSARPASATVPRSRRSASACGRR